MIENERAMREEGEVIYLDNAATTFPKPASVYSEATKFYSHHGGNAGRGGNPLARASTQLLAESRELLAEWLEAPSFESVIFTASSTHALNQAVFGAELRPGEILYVTPFEHNSILRPVEHLRQTKGIQVRQIPFTRKTYKCQLDKLEAMFQKEPPAVVCVTQASNVCGVMPPVQEIAKLAKETNPQAVIIVDGSQTAGLYPLNLRSGLFDAFIFSGHKSLYGPYGIAGLILGTAWRPKPLLFGGTGTFSESINMPADLPSAYEAGSHNIWAIAGLNAAIRWLEQTGREALTTHTLRLARQLCIGLSDLPGVEVHAPFSPLSWSGITSFTVDGLSPQAIETAMGAKEVAVRAGLHCAPWAHKWLGTLSVGGSVRVSPGYFNNSADIEQFLEILNSIIV